MSSVRVKSGVESGAGVNGGAYRLHFRLNHAAWIEPGRLGRFRLEPGHYVYVGSARRNLSQRVARHRRLSTEKAGNRHWHIDALSLHRFSHLIEVEILEGADECRLSAQLAARHDVSVPIAGFGATDCKAGCHSHLYRVEDGG